MEIKSTPIHNSYWVIPNRFRAGEYPGSINEDEARNKLRWIIDQGINLILDLTEPGEGGLKPYAYLFIEEGKRLSQMVEYKQIAIRDFTIPSRQKMVKILDAIDLALSEGNNIYLHCFGGMGRTGTVVGCFLVRHGMSGDKSLETIQLLRKDIPGKFEISPETKGQRRMVLEWKLKQ
jgi:protein tyrosine/serine phosphatase